jgi:hypothetical protein
MKQVRIEIRLSTLVILWAAGSLAWFWYWS